MTVRPDSRRKQELLDRAYEYCGDNGIAGLSLRPLAEAIGTSPRVLLFLFGSKDGLVSALLDRARADQLDLLRSMGDASSLPDVAERLWTWLAAPAQRKLLTLWAESYVQSVIEPDGPWAGFAATTISDWLVLLRSAQPARLRRTKRGEIQRTQVLAMLRGSLLDLLASQDAERTSAAVNEFIATLHDPR